MANVSGTNSASGTLVAATTDTVTLNKPYPIITVENTGSATIYVSVNGVAPTVGGDFIAIPANSIQTIADINQYQGESALTNGVAGPTWTNALDGTPIPSSWVTTPSGAKFSRGVDTGNIRTNPANVAIDTIILISSGTPTYVVEGAT